MIERPLGVTIICILGFISAIFALMSGIILTTITSLFQNSIITLFGFLGYILIIIAIANFIGFYLLLKMKRTGWVIVTVMGIISIILGIASFGIDSLVSIIISAVIVGYLFMKRKLFA
ncbi:MAG: hypothetical protein GTN76_05525 [Candidatus Aenigmarchaeota archaeon]|nr:hypothetical protein [Candidatus Aenigmarchaeota archaeon]